MEVKQTTFSFKFYVYAFMCSALLLIHPNLQLQTGPQRSVFKDGILIYVICHSRKWKHYNWLNKRNIYSILIFFPGRRAGGIWKGMHKAICELSGKAKQFKFPFSSEKRALIKFQDVGGSCLKPGCFSPCSGDGCLNIKVQLMTSLQLNYQAMCVE
jgi:hypothetical protein